MTQSGNSRKCKLFPKPKLCQDSPDSPPAPQAEVVPEDVDVSPAERKVSSQSRIPLPVSSSLPEPVLTPAPDCEPRETSSPISSPVPSPVSSPVSSPLPPPDHPETPRKRTLPARPTVPPKPDFSREAREARATSEPAVVPAGVLSGGEPISLPPSIAQQATDSPMPELLSLKDRLKLFEKEIEDQHKDPEPKKDRKFSFLSEDEVTKMKEEEAKRIASMTAMSMEAFESLTSQVSTDDQILTQQIEDLEKYDTSAPSNTEESAPLPAQEEKAEQQSEMVADIVTDPTDPSMTEAEKRAAWRKARLQSLEDDALQAQMVIERMSELTTAESQDSKSESDRRVST